MDGKKRWDASTAFPLYYSVKATTTINYHHPIGPMIASYTLS